VRKGARLRAVRTGEPRRGTCARAASRRFAYLTNPMMGKLSDRKGEDQIKEELDVGHARMAVCFARAKQV
jgi:hypothetical protein